MSNTEKNELLIYYSCLKRFSRFSWKITNIHTITSKKPCHRLHERKPPRKSKLRRRIVSQTTVLVHSVTKKYQLYAMNIFPSTRSLMQGTIQPNIKSLSIIHFFVRYFVPS